MDRDRDNANLGSSISSRRLAGIRVFYYHGVVERKKDPLLERNFVLISEFRAHLRFLRKFRVLGLGQLRAELSNSQSPFLPGAVITFDDGYANNLVAAELTDVERLPWSLFISTGGIGSGKTLWPEELALLLLRGEAVTLEAFDRKWHLTDRDERVRAFRWIQPAMKLLPARLRRNLMDNIRSQFPKAELSRLLSDFPSMCMLSWEQTAHLAANGVEIASHGVDHEIHHTTQDPATRYHELTMSKTELAGRLDRQCDFFAFPNGDFVTSSAKEVAQAGYTLGFTTQADVVTALSNPYLLPRLYPPGPIEQFAREFYWGSAFD
jgi:peptidoglycan/xylan/chitin deacetylase (PgdA/CDA1 family)